MSAPQPIIAQIQAGMIAALQTASDADRLGFRFRKVASYGQEFGEGLRRVVQDFPAAWIVFAGERGVSDRATDQWVVDGEFAVLVGARQLSSEAASREGRGAEPGSYQLIHAVRRVLLGQTFGLEIAPLNPAPVRPIANDQSERDFISIYAVPFRTRYIVEEEHAFDDFATGAFTWSRPEDDGAPAGGTPAGSDTITLETAP